jgi:hypothetical protein
MLEIPARLAAAHPTGLKAVRTDCELQCPKIDAGLVTRSLDLLTLPENVSEERLTAEVAHADLLLMCYTPITARVIAGARRLRGIVKPGWAWEPQNHRNYPDLRANKQNIFAENNDF